MKSSQAVIIMKITIGFKDQATDESNNYFDCKIEITDLTGTHFYVISHNNAGGGYITADVSGDEFDVTVTPIISDCSEDSDNAEPKTLGNKILESAIKASVSLFDKVLLMVGCTYRITGLQDGDRLSIDIQDYTLGATGFMFELFELMPIMYCFFEVSFFNDRFAPKKAFAVNRKKFLKGSRVMALMEPLTYLMAMIRARRLSKNRKIFSILSKFHGMSEEKRQKVKKAQYN